jgi:hypothetical protein
MGKVLPKKPTKKTATKKAAAKTVSPTVKTKRKPKKKKVVVVANPACRPVEWDPVIIAHDLNVWVEEQYANCTIIKSLVGNTLNNPVPMIEAFCYEHKSPVTGKRLGKYIYELAKKCPELSDAIHMCACARAAKVDFGAMVGAINPGYAALVQKQKTAAEFTDKQEHEHSGELKTTQIFYPAPLPEGAPC